MVAHFQTPVLWNAYVEHLVLDPTNPHHALEMTAVPYHTLAASKVEDSAKCLRQQVRPLVSRWLWGTTVAPEQAAVHLQAVLILQKGLRHKRDNSFKVWNRVWHRPGSSHTSEARSLLHSKSHCSKAICSQTHFHSSRRASKAQNHL